MTSAAVPPTSRWLRLLPLAVVLLVGLWLWQGGAGLVAVEHTLVWKVPGPYGSVRKLELQLWDAEKLLLRAQLEAPTGLGFDPERKLTLKRGRYRSELLVWREDAAAPQISRIFVEVDSDPVVVIH